MTTAVLNKFDIPNFGIQRLAARLIAWTVERKSQGKRRAIGNARVYSFVGENLLDPHLGQEIRRIQR